MFENCYKPSRKTVETIEWKGDPVKYDFELSTLGNGKDKTLILNPRIPDKDFVYHADEFPDTDKCIVYIHDGDWVAKIFPPGWEPHWNAYLELEIVKPKLVWNKNPDIDKLMTFENDPFGSFEPSPWDCNYKLVWYLDPRVNPLSDKVWAMSCQAIGREIKGIKEMGYLMPQIDVEFNEDLPDIGVNVDECYPAFYHLNWECAWELDPAHQTDRQLWVVKFTPRYRKPKGWKWYGTISPNFKIKYNPDLPNLNYDIDCVIPWHDLAYEHIWMLDSKHMLEGEKEMWAFSMCAVNKPVGKKFVDYVSPIYKYEFNPDLPNLNYDVDYTPKWFNLNYKHVWMLDNKHLPNGEEEIWAFTMSATDDPEGTKVIDYISPHANLKVNSAVKGYNFDIEYDPPWYDLGYEHIWMLDRDYYPDHNEMWAVKYSYGDKVKGSKIIDEVAPTQVLEFNTALKNLYIEIDYKIPYHDRKYLHVWYTELDGEEIWAAKLKAVEKPTGTKDMGRVVPMIPKQLDVFFISYNEPNAEENWQRLLTFAPNAKRIHGIKGILNAHKAAAQQAKTDMFYVVDGDAWIADDWSFDFQPTLYDRDCVHLWTSHNPITNLNYGYGGIKLFPTASVKKINRWGTDLTLSVGKKLKVFDTISNITKFNASEFDTWRSAFRECAKLALKDDDESQERLAAWLNPNKDADYSEWARLGAEQGAAYAESNPSIDHVNDYTWLKTQFDKIKEDNNE